MANLIEKFCRWRGFVPAAELESAKKATSEALGMLGAEQARHADTRRQMNEARAFIDGKLQPLTQLEPAMEWPHPRSFEPSLAAIDDTYDTAHARVAELIRGARRDVVVKVAIPAVFDYWNATRDLRAIDEAIEFIAKAAAHKIAGTLRFGLTGSRK